MYRAGGPLSARQMIHAPQRLLEEPPSVRCWVVWRGAGGRGGALTFWATCGRTGLARGCEGAAGILGVWGYVSGVVWWSRGCVWMVGETIVDAREQS